MSSSREMDEVFINATRLYATAGAAVTLIEGLIREPPLYTKEEALAYLESYKDQMAKCRPCLQSDDGIVRIR